MLNIKLYRTRKCTLLTGIAISAVVVSTPTLAQNGEVIVTAQKREQSIMDIPMSVTAVSSKNIEANIVRDVFDLRSLAPSLEARTVDPPSQGASFSIRGLGTSVFNMGLEPSVGTYVDGVYRSRSGLIGASNLLDLERVEVLKGPQGTLFGKNSTAGVVQFISKKPEIGSAGGFAEFSYNNLDQIVVGGVANLPLGDNAAARFSANFHKGDGWIDEVNSGETYNDRDRFSLRGQLYFEPQENLNIRLIADYAKVDENGIWPVRLINDPNTSVFNGPLTTAIGTTLIDPADPSAHRVSSNFVSDYEAEDIGLSAEINYDFGGAKLTSVTAIRDFEDSHLKDNDFTGVDILNNQDTLPKVGLFSQELRLSGQAGADDNIDWIVGLYYADEKIERTREFLWGSQVGVFPFGATPGRAFFHRFNQDGETFAGFAHVTANLSDRFALTGGIRYSSDKKDGSMVSDIPLTNLFMLPNTFPLPLTHDFVAAVDDNAISGTVSGQYDLSENVMAYATYSRGFKAGGISLARDAAGNAAIFTPMGPVFGLPAQDPTFEKETADHFEGGVKSTFNGGRFEATVFTTKFDDLQQQVLQPDGSFSVINVAGAKSSGAEASVSFSLTDNFDINASALYVDAKFSDGVGSIAQGGRVLDGTPLPFVSDFTGSVGADFSAPISDGGAEFFANGNVFFRGEQVQDVNFGQTQDGYALFNLRAGLRFMDGSVEASVWCKNCGDKTYSNSNFAIPFDGEVFFPQTRWGHLGAPQIYGATLRYNFD